MSTPDIQVAFQGGGAKLVAMLPIAHAFSTAQNQGRANIKAAAGTSAGAICAALLAAEADFNKVREFLKAHGEQWITALTPSELRQLIKDLENGRRPGLFSLWTFRRPLQDVLLEGKPVLLGNQLRGFFSDLFKAATGNPNPTVDKQRSALTIIASDIVKSAAVTHRSGDLASALVDSCSLPVLLRSFDSLAASHHVDGGLCDNLPVEGLLADRQAPVFVVYPTDRSEPKPIRNLLSYIASLLAASINHGVTRSLDMVSSQFRFPVESDVGLLEFRKALALLNDDDWYEARRAEAYDRIIDFCEFFGVVGDEYEQRVADIMDMAHYEDALEQITSRFAAQVDVTFGRFVVHVKCDKRVDDAADLGKREPDEITRTSRFVSKVAELAFYRANLRLEANRIVPTIWRATNLTTGRKLKIKILPLSTRDLPSVPAKYCLLQFVEPTEIRMNDEIEVTSVYRSTPNNDMVSLNLGKSDFFGFLNPQADTVGRAELVLIYPKLLGRLSMITHPERGTRRQSEPVDFAKYPLHVSGDEHVAGIYVENLKLNESIYAHISRV